MCIPLAEAAAAAKSLPSCPTLCDPIGGSPPGSSVPGILQARTLEWAAISFSSACMQAKSLQLYPALCDLWAAARQAPLSLGFSRHFLSISCPLAEESALHLEGRRVC